MHLSYWADKYNKRVHVTKEQGLYILMWVKCLNVQLHNKEYTFLCRLGTYMFSYNNKEYTLLSVSGT